MAGGAADITARVLAQKLDVTHAADIAPAVEAAVRRFGRIDYLFNNAGYGVIGALEETSESELRALLDTGARTSLLTAAAARASGVTI